jgi:hypothetical protein
MIINNNLVINEQKKTKKNCFEIKFCNIITLLSFSFGFLRVLAIIMNIEI